MVYDQNYNDEDIKDAAKCITSEYMGLHYMRKKRLINFVFQLFGIVLVILLLIVFILGVYNIIIEDAILLSGLIVGTLLVVLIIERRYIKALTSNFKKNKNYSIDISDNSITIFEKRFNISEIDRIVVTRKIIMLYINDQIIYIKKSSDLNSCFKNVVVDK